MNKMLIQPKYQSENANAPIALGELPVEIGFGGKSVHASGRLELRLLPENRVLISVHSDHYDQFPAFGHDATMIRVGDTAKPVPAFALKSNHSSSGVNIEYLPKISRITLCRDRRVRLRAADFHMINFPEFFSTGAGGTDLAYENAGNHMRLGHVRLTNGEWATA